MFTQEELNEMEALDRAYIESDLYHARHLDKYIAEKRAEFLAKGMTEEEIEDEFIYMMEEEQAESLY
jgi:hypothetical protein